MLNALFIDDNHNFKQAVVETLDEYFTNGLCIYQAPNRDYASLLLEQKCFDLVLLDSCMSGEKGQEIISLIRRLSRDKVSIVVLGDFDMPEYKDHMLDAGADAYIPKSSDCFFCLSEHITHLMMENTDDVGNRLH